MKKGIYDTDKLRKQFIDIYGEEPRLFRSPGRINIIGEHTDYNDGFVLPAAINQAAYVAATPRNDQQIRLYSVSFNEHFSCTTDTLERRGGAWTDYVLGVADQLLKKNYPIAGFNLLIDGDIVIGAGLSSSAAVECCVLYALDDLFQLGLEKMELATLSQMAEHEFAGVKCGIMDQFASVFGKTEHAVKLDCRSLAFEYIPLDLKEYTILLLNSNVKHSLADSEYNTRRLQCEQGVQWVAAEEPDIRSMRDVTLQQLNAYVQPKDELIYRRCKYVIEENERLLQACSDLSGGNMEGLGRQLFGSHRGLSEDYEVSCPELDWLVNFVKNKPAVMGARMMGGGFGGCTINLVRKNAAAALVEEAATLYKTTYGLDLEAYAVETADGTSGINS